MPHSPQPQVRTEEESDMPENIELAYDRPLPNERLVVTSKLHPFWKTKNGLATVVLVILVFIGAIVGAAVGGARAGGNMKSNDTNSTSSAASPATSTTSSRVIGEVLATGTLAPRINNDFPGRRTHGRAFFDPSSPITSNPTIITPPALFKVLS